MAAAPTKDKLKTKTVLNLRVEIESENILDDLELIKEIVESGRGYGSVSGFIEINGVNVGEVS